MQGSQVALGKKRQEILLRASTHAGLLRLVELDKSIVEGTSITIFPLAGGTDLEESPTAALHRRRVEEALAANSHKTRCLSCGRPVCETTAQIVETGRDSDLRAGLVHFSCLSPQHRVIGGAMFMLADAYPELINFDAAAWMSAANSGQQGFASLQIVRDREVIFGWGGRLSAEPDLPFVIECVLESNDIQWVTKRNRVQRFSLNDANRFAALLRRESQEHHDDPSCYSSETRAFARRSLLLQQLGNSERILKIVDISVRRFEPHAASAFETAGSWYAPLFYLRDRETGIPFSILGCVVLFREPTTLKLHLDNWRDVGVPIPAYEIVALVADDSVDAFLEATFASERQIIIDPALVVDETTRFVAGYRMIPIAKLGSAPVGIADSQ